LYRRGRTPRGACRQRALGISERAFGSLHPEVAALLERIGQLDRGTHHASAPRPAREPLPG